MKMEMKMKKKILTVQMNQKINYIQKKKLTKSTRAYNQGNTN